MTEAPPSLDGADHDTLSCELPNVSVGAAGVLGRVEGYSEADDADHGLSPTLFVARTCTW